MKINQLSELIGSVIPEITLTVDACYPTKTGASNGKPWARQDLTCSDDTGKIKVSVWNHSEMEQAIKGTQVKFRSVPSKRGSGLIGLKCIENEYNGVKSVQLKVDDAGIIITQAGSLGSKSLDTGYDKKQTLMQDVPKISLEKAYGELATGPVKPSTNDPSAKLGQYRILYQNCLSEADKVKHIGFSNEDFRQIATCFFIQGIKDGLHLQMTVKPDLENDDLTF